MKTVFSREPDSANMVTEPGPYSSIDILCVECGWEGTAFHPAAPWPVFREHPCKLRAESVSTL